ncbi:zona pellucida sperm-binding protein 4-like [Anarrhichthys ocellatus]|uniref:zona pellucida sperm-binding protein 4-like n=1 Tax=Anarrhichthys ocellatus TaxID=433405 RepID=UPI0012EE9E3A|nr:zona pellucida sperm-binding protein 4-like [Anarrhichthys ocellatus]
MAMKLICGCLLAVAMIGYLADAQYQPTKPQNLWPPKPQVTALNPWPPKPQVTPLNPWPLKPQATSQNPWPLKPQLHPLSPQHPQVSPPSPWKPQVSPPSPWNPQVSPPSPWQPQVSPKPLHPTDTVHSCEVADQYKIPCGASGTTALACGALNCCFDGQSCYYGKAVTLQCTKDGQIIVVVARDATLPYLDLDSISFLGNDENCSPVGTTSAFAIYQFPVTACGTVKNDEPGILIYENRMSSTYEVAMGPYGIITRDSQYELVFQCRYVGSSIEALVVEVGLVPPPPPVAAPGPLRVELRLGNGQCTMKGCMEEDVAYNSFYVDSDYPVTKVLRDPVYVEVRMLERTDPNLVLTLGRCWATSNPYAHSLPQWDLLIDGCPYRDDRYQTVLIPVNSPDILYPTHYKHFVFKMFTFVTTVANHPSKKTTANAEVMVPLHEKVYIHCDTAVCQPTLGNNCEPRCFRKRRDVAALSHGGSTAESTLVSSKELVLINASSIQ